jgi:hypothetical protein
MTGVGLSLFYAFCNRADTGCRLVVRVSSGRFRMVKTKTNRLKQAGIPALFTHYQFRRSIPTRLENFPALAHLRG